MLFCLACTSHCPDAARYTPEGYAYCETYNQDEGTAICYSWGTRDEMGKVRAALGEYAGQYVIVPLPVGFARG